MTHPHPRALEAAARAALQSIVKRESEIVGRPVEPDAFSEIAAIDDARAAVTAYLAALQETHALVPRAPAEAMVKAAAYVLAWDFGVIGSGEPAEEIAEEVYRAMIDAAPPAAQEKK
jgi:hypothetical protein